MPAAVYDYEAIAKARAVLNGEEPTGRYFARDESGNFSPAESPHPFGRVPQELGSLNCKYAATIMSVVFEQIGERGL